jgi:ribose transport system permease protein
VSTRTVDQTPSPDAGAPLPRRTHAGVPRFLRRVVGRPRDVVDGRMLALTGVLVTICVVGYLTRPDAFLTQSNISTMLRLAAAIGVVSVGMTFVIIGGGIDLSVGSIVALSSVWMTTLATQSYGPGVMIFCAIAVGAACGLVNGVLVGYGRMVPFIATLAMYIAARGLAERISDGQTQVVRETGFTTPLRGQLLGVPVLIWIFAAVVLVGWVVLQRTTFGRRTVAVGGNPEAARLAGIDVRRHTMLLYVIVGICCGIAAIMVVARTTSGASTNGQFYELDAIAAVVIGGTLLSGGKGSLVGTLLGVLIFTAVSNVFTLNNLETDVQNIAKGAIIVIAVLFQSLRLRRTRSPAKIGATR